MGEEFTFPSCTQPEQRGGASKSLAFPQFASPPPWFFVSVPGADEDRHRRCFSAVEKPTKVTNKDDGYYYIHGGGGSERFAMAEEQHKMDMLWEDFNEELACAAPVCPLSPLHGDGGGGGLMTMAMMKDAAWLDSDSDGDVGGGPAGKLRRRRHYMVVRRRRWSLVLMLRLLKKLFLAKKSRTSHSQRTAPL